MDIGLEPLLPNDLPLFLLKSSIGLLFEEFLKKIIINYIVILKIMP